MDNNKINIITYYRAANYGAFLQAFALQNYLLQIGYDAKIYEYSITDEKIRTIVYRILRSKKVLKGKQKEYNDSIHQKVLQFQNKLIKTINPKCDFTIIGSDEVWNLNNFCAPHNNCFFQKSPNSKITFSYAACSGVDSLSKIKIGKNTILKVKSLDYCSVRDDNTEKLAKEIGIKNVTRVLDPTFLYDFNSLINERIVNDKYLFVYSYGLDDSVIKNINGFAKKEKLKVVYTGSFTDQCDINPTPNPFEWLNLIKYAEYVITSTFHGTVFSIQLNKQFIVINNNSPKIQSVLKEFDLVSRDLNNMKLENMINNQIDYSIINERILLLTNNSRNYLHNCLHIKEKTYE